MWEEELSPSMRRAKEWLKDVSYGDMEPAGFRDRDESRTGPEPEETDLLGEILDFELPAAAPELVSIDERSTSSRIS